VASLKNTNVLPPVSGRTIRLDTVDSTNNYAMHHIDAGTAEHGDVILAIEQTMGRGQRGKSWYNTVGESLCMSVIVAPEVGLDAQPSFLAATTVAVSRVLEQYLPAVKTAIKWPNDILIGDKKAVGILIENVVRGSVWQWAVIGIGINVGQETFPENLPYATSLRMQGGAVDSIDELATGIAGAVVQACGALPAQTGAEVFDAYNERLYQKDRLQTFRWGYDVIVRRVLEVDVTGKLRVRNQDGGIDLLNHGAAEWIWK
jgi:BirA family biotin operon repressor/biotin-[acetyl-CoA-carboxylase] ligase